MHILLIKLKEKNHVKKNRKVIPYYMIFNTVSDILDPVKLNYCPLLKNLPQIQIKIFNDMFHNFTTDTSERDWSVIYCVVFFTFLYAGATFACFQLDGMQFF
jgi:hypothetical protein